MPPRRIVVVGASEAGCRFALAAHYAGHEVTLVDEHPQLLKDMSLNAPYFYGAGLPAALTNENAIAQSVLEASPEVAACFEKGIDVRVSTVLWGAFRNSKNSLHIGTPKAGVVTRGGNELIEHDVLVVAAGVRDFVPSFRGWELPGVLGAKAGLALLDVYGVFEGERVLVLGTSDLAMRFIRSARARGVAVAGVVEPGETVVAGPDAAGWLAAQGIKVHFGHVISETTGKGLVEAASLVALDGTPGEVLVCDTIVVAIATLPNIELPAAMGCRMRYEARIASWVPEVSVQGETSCEGVFHLSGASGADDAFIAAILARIDGAAADPTLAPTRAAHGDTSAYIQHWIKALHETGGPDVVMCQCESVTRGELCGMAPPRYLERGLRTQQTPVNLTDDPNAPRVNQDMLKRLTRVGMGYCQGKRCRDEAAFTLMQRFGVGLQDVRPASYRFPLRPIDLELLADNDETEDIRANWQMWPYETREA